MAGLIEQPDGLYLYILVKGKSIVLLEKINHSFWNLFICISWKVLQKTWNPRDSRSDGSGQIYIRKWSLVLLLGASFQRIRNAHVNQISLDPFTRIFQTKKNWILKLVFTYPDFRRIHGGLTEWRYVVLLVYCSICLRAFVSSKIQIFFHSSVHVVLHSNINQKRVKQTSISLFVEPRGPS